VASDCLRVAYFGPEGTNTHAAALALFQATSSIRQSTPPDVGSASWPPIEFFAEPTIRRVFEAVADGRAHRGVVPIENSTEGGVAQTLDCLFELPPVIRAEYVAEIHHFLLGRGTLEPERVLQVLSHPQALAQCQAWLARHLPEAELVPVASTSAAARLAAREPRQVAIASELAAELYGLDVLARHIEDQEHNATRFVALALEDAPCTGADKTSIVFTTRHERGALRRVLAVLDDAGLNLTRIESRPLPHRRWEYAFFTDVEGSRLDPAMGQALAQLGTVCGTVKVLGSYPRAGMRVLPGRLL
jgi:chorismate mutase/prephenate dehydratase